MAQVTNSQRFKLIKPEVKKLESEEKLSLIDNSEDKPKTLRNFFY